MNTIQSGNRTSAKFHKWNKVAVMGEGTVAPRRRNYRAHMLCMLILVLETV